MTDLHTPSIPTIPDFHGQLIAPNDAGYDEARAVFNGMIDRRPSMIARCTSTEDVAAAVRHARRHSLNLSVYAGGHGVTGSAMVEGGLCIDLRGMRAVGVDPAARVATIAGGARWGDVDPVTQEHGLAVTGGRVSTTGVAGLALGSGSGWIERKYGLTCDSLLSAEVVTADGDVVRASETDNADLFWALRGGGGNFGIVTEFRFRLHEVGPILLAGMLMYPASMAADVTRRVREFFTDAPDEVCGGLALVSAPPADFVPEPVRGKPVAGVVLLYVGDIEEGRRALAPMLEFGPPAVNLVQPMPYVAVQQMLDQACPSGLQNYWTADFLDDLPDDAVDILVGHGTRPISPMTQINLLPGGGAMARVPADATAFTQRQAPWNVHYLSMWHDPAATEVNIAWTREISRAMKPWASNHVYLNFIGDEGQERVNSAFPPATWARLREIKRQWDPDNVFHLNQNIPPAD